MPTVVYADDVAADTWPCLLNDEYLDVSLKVPTIVSPLLFLSAPIAMLGWIGSSQTCSVYKVRLIAEPANSCVYHADEN